MDRHIRGHESLWGRKRTPRPGISHDRKEDDKDGTYNYPIFDKDVCTEKDWRRVLRDADARPRRGPDLDGPRRLGGPNEVKDQVNEVLGHRRTGREDRKVDDRESDTLRGPKPRKSRCRDGDDGL